MDTCESVPTKTVRYELKVKSLNALHLSGSLKAEAGPLKTESLALHISGSGNHQAPDLESNEATVGISGSGHAALWVKERLEASITGRGELEYFGSPKVSKHTSGSGAFTLETANSGP